MARATRSATKSPASKSASSKSASKSPTNKRGHAVEMVDRDAGSVSSTRQASFTAPTLSTRKAETVVDVLGQRLISLIDLAMTLKHIHWNVVGPNFIAVHEMLDPQYHGVQSMVDELAERIATLGGVPCGLPGQIVAQRTWDDYDLGRADAIGHLAALDLVYTGVIEDQRKAIERTEKPDVLSQDLLIGHTRELEKYQWFVRSHLADWAGGMANAGATSEVGAAKAVRAKAARPTSSRTPR